MAGVLQRFETVAERKAGMTPDELHKATKGFTEGTPINIESVSGWVYRNAEFIEISSKGELHWNNVNDGRKAFIISKSSDIVSVVRS